MIRSRRDARTVVAVVAIFVVVSGVAFGSHRLVLPTFGAPTQLRNDAATLVNGLPAVENRDLTDPGEGKRWSPLAMLAATIAVAAGLLWRRFDLRSRILVPAAPTVVGARGPPQG